MALVLNTLLIVVHFRDFHSYLPQVQKHTTGRRPTSTIGDDAVEPVVLVAASLEGREQVGSMAPLRHEDAGPVVRLEHVDDLGVERSSGVGEAPVETCDDLACGAEEMSELGPACGRIHT